MNKKGLIMPIALSQFLFLFTCPIHANETAPITSKRQETMISVLKQTFNQDLSNLEYLKTEKDVHIFENEVYIDGVKLDVANFDSKSGSTIIILKNNYLKTLSVGKHTLKVKFSNGKVAVTNFTIAKEGITNPNTKDNIFMYVGMLGISLTGVIILSAVNRKKHNTEYHNV